MTIAAHHDDFLSRHEVMAQFEQMRGNAIFQLCAMVVRYFRPIPQIELWFFFQGFYFVMRERIDSEMVIKPLQDVHPICHGLVRHGKVFPQ